MVEETLADIDATDKPTLMVFNKIDAYKYTPQDEDDLSPPTRENISLEELKNTWMSKLKEGEVIFISAHDKTNFEEFKDTLYELTKRVHQERYPYNHFLY